MATMKTVYTLLESINLLHNALNDADAKLISARPAIYEAGQSEDYVAAADSLITIRKALDKIPVARLDHI